jgi:hypothetical protein
MSFSSLPYRSPKKFKPSPSSHLNKTQRFTENQNQWNSYLTDDHRFSLSSEELLNRKKRLISKHNILTNPSPKPMKPKIKKISEKKSHPGDRAGSGASSARAGDEAEEEYTSVLDLLTSDHDSTDDDDDGGDDDSLVPETTSSAKATRKPLSSSSPHSSQQKKYNATPTKKKSFSHRSVVPVSRKESTEESSAVPQRDLKEIRRMIRSLHQELEYYEELSGRRSFLDVEELNSALGINSSDQSEAISTTATMRYLVQLVHIPSLNLPVSVCLTLLCSSLLRCVRP